MNGCFQANILAVWAVQPRFFFFFYYTKNTDGSFTVCLRIRSQLVNQPMFELKLKAPSRNAAMNACKKWQEIAPNIYENIYETLIEE